MTRPHTTRPDADAALALLRAEFPEPWKVNLWPLTVLSGRWSADALIVGEWEGSAELRAQGPTPLSAASALIAAWRAATKPLTEGRTYFDASAAEAERWKEVANELAERMRHDHSGGAPCFVDCDGCELVARLLPAPQAQGENERGSGS